MALNWKHIVYMQRTWCRPTQAVCMLVMHPLRVQGLGFPLCILATSWVCSGVWTPNWLLFLSLHLIAHSNMTHFLVTETC